MKTLIKIAAIAVTTLLMLGIASRYAVRKRK